MAKQDYVPTEIDKIDTFLDKWKTNIAAALTSLGLPATHADAILAKLNPTRTKFSDWKLIQDEAQSKSTAFYDALKDLLKDMRPYNQNLKTTNSYSDVVGQTLGIVGPEEVPFDPVSAKPTAKGVYTGGKVNIKFNHPRAVAAVRITCKRGSETAFSFVADDTNSPYDDHRPNLDPTKPENREYILQFIDKTGALIGQVSDTVKITVA